MLVELFISKVNFLLAIKLHIVARKNDTAFAVMWCLFQKLISLVSKK